MPSSRLLFRGFPGLHSSKPNLEAADAVFSAYMIIASRLAAEHDIRTVNSFQQQIPRST